MAALASAGEQTQPQLLSTPSAHSSKLHGPLGAPKLNPPRSWRGAGERLQPWESQLLFGCECSWRYSLLSGLRYNYCLDLLPLLFLFSSSRTVTQAGPPRSCGEAGCPPCRGTGSLSLEPPRYLQSIILYFGPVTAPWIIMPPSCISLLELCVSVLSLSIPSSSIYLPTQVAG